MRVIDGMHRLRAAQLRAAKKIEVKFFDGTDDLAFLLAVRANVAHGLPLSKADRVAAAARIIESRPQWSDRAIASAAGPSPSTVKAARKRSTDAGQQLNARLGRDEAQPQAAVRGGRPALTRWMRKYEQDAAAAGVELRMEEVYGSILVAEDAPCEPGPGVPCTWEMCCWNGGWAYHYPSGEILFKTGADGNFGFYTDPRADALIEKTVTSDDLDALYEYQDFIANEVPVIFTPNFPIRLFEVANNLRGFGAVNPFGMINPENWYYIEE